MRLMRIFIDLETTGLNPVINGITEIGMMIEIDGKVAKADVYNSFVAPHPKDEINEEALEITGKSTQEIKTYPNIKKVFTDVKQLLGKYIDPFNKKDKAFFVGYNAYFDYQFMRLWFQKNSDKFFGSWFWYPPQDVMILACKYMERHRQELSNFKLGTVAEYLGIPVDTEKLHGALYDIETTRTMYHMISGK